MGFHHGVLDGCQLEQIIKILLGVTSISKLTHVCEPSFGLSRILIGTHSSLFLAKRKT
tara:strand:+ start:49 stop:222 length:174 start_codon:yes stop_codon:yes gene_type:complete